jgi:hypothetical protein
MHASIERCTGWMASRDVHFVDLVMGMWCWILLIGTVVLRYRSTCASARLIRFEHFDAILKRASLIGLSRG